MINVLFVCHGNICRSPMAEFVFKNMCDERGITGQFYAESAATSREEIGNPIYPPARRTLSAAGIPFDSRKCARQITPADYDKFDYIVCMDGYNLRNITRIIPSDPAHKIYRLMDFTESPRDVADPWYTGDFTQTLSDVTEGCDALISHILNK